VDYRDVISSIDLLHHVANRIGINAKELLVEIAGLSESGVADLMLRSSKQPQQDKDVRFAAGYAEIETPDGIGFANCYYYPYHPTYKLDQIIQEISDLLASDQYPINNITIGADIPRFWLKAGNSKVLNKALGNVKAVASLSAQLRPSAYPEHVYQMLIIFLAELTDNIYAKSLCKIAENSRPSTFSIHGLAVDRLFCLIVSRSVAQGVKPFETSKGLKRFMQPISKIFQKYVV